jgi:hypothetical protein
MRFSCGEGVLGCLIEGNHRLNRVGCLGLIGHKNSAGRKSGHQINWAFVKTKNSSGLSQSALTKGQALVAAALAAAPVFPGPGFVDVERAATQLFAVERLNRSLG